MKLSELKYRNLLYLVLIKNQVAFDKIVYQESTKFNEVCDFGIVFGGISMIPKRVGIAVSLYKKGLIKKIIVSGGIGFLSKNRKIPEAFKMRSFLLENGVLEDDVILESKSRDSFENIRNSFNLIRNNQKMGNIKIVLITSDFHLKRCMGIAQLLDKNKFKIFGYEVKNGKTDRENWYHTRSSRIAIYREACNLLYFVRRGKMCDIEIKNLSLKK